jgi:hypothetical protein
MGRCLSSYEGLIVCACAAPEKGWSVIAWVRIPPSPPLSLRGHSLFSKLGRKRHPFAPMLRWPNGTRLAPNRFRICSISVLGAMHHAIETNAMPIL